MSKKNRKKNRKVSGTAPGNRKTQRATNVVQPEARHNFLEALESIMKKSQHHDTQQAASAKEWPEPTSFAGPAQNAFMVFPTEVMPSSFMAVVVSFSRAFAVSMETIMVLLTFMVSAAVGKSVRVKTATGEWVDVGHHLVIVSESWEKVSKVILAMSTIFLEVRFQQTGTHVASGTDADNFRRWAEKVFDELSGSNISRSAALRGAFHELAVRAKVPQIPKLSDDEKINRPNFACPPVLDGICWGLVTGEPGYDIVCGDAAYVINLNGTPLPAFIEGQSDRVADSTPDHICVITPKVIAENIVVGSAKYLFKYPYALADSIDSDKVNNDELRAGEEQLSYLREILIRAFQIGARRNGTSIDLVLSAEAAKKRDLHHMLASLTDPNAGVLVAIVQLATKYSAIFELFDEERSNDEISIDSWTGGSMLAAYLYNNQLKALKAVHVDPANSKAERLLQHAAGLAAPFTIDEIVGKNCAGIANKDEAIVALKVLVELGWVRLVAKAEGDQEEQFEFHPRAFEPASSSPDSKSTPSSDQPGAE